MNKKLIILIIVLVPIVVISFFKKETNFILDEKEIYIKIKRDNLIEKVLLEEYVIGVVAAEMPALYHKEALKAQAIASRTYVLNYYNVNNKYDVDNTTKYQAYIDKKEMKEKWHNNYDEYYNRIKNIVYSTKDMIITYDNSIIKSLYFSQSNGYTENSINVFKEQLPYLVSVESKEINKEIITNIPKNDFCIKLQIKNCNEIIISNSIKNATNRVDEITINGIVYTGIEIRKLFNLRSTDFIIDVNNQVIIKTNGYGHGVGMSQQGANLMAKEGYNYEEIIKHYYQNTIITNINSINI